MCISCILHKVLYYLLIASPVKQLGPPIVNENSVAEVLQSLMESRHAFDQSDNTRVFSEFKHPDEQSPFIPLQVCMVCICNSYSTLDRNLWQ